ncbi:hypothetical protein ACTXT7_007639 [Hymenolepis weldensis]
MAHRSFWLSLVFLINNNDGRSELVLVGSGIRAARIVGFPGSVTNQGNLRLFEAMYVARTTQAELQSAQSVAKRIKAKNSGTHHSSSYSHSSAPLVFRCRAMTSPAFMRINSGSGCAAAQKSINLHFTECRVFLFDQCLIIAEDNNPSPSANTSSENTSVSNGFQANLGRVVYGSGSLFQRMGSCTFDLRPQRSLRLFTDDVSHTPICGGRSPSVRRPVRIRRHGSPLSSLEFDSSGTFGGSGGNWPKLGWSTPHDPFRQSNYKFIHAVKVNRMAFTESGFEEKEFNGIEDCNPPNQARERVIASDWLSPNMKHLDSPDMGSENPHDHSTTSKLQNSDVSTMASINITSASTGHSHSEHSTEEDGKCFNKGKLGNCQAPDRFWFAIVDKAPSSDAVFILDPFSEEAREAWLLEIADIAEMQAQLQMALQNPRQFCFANSMRRQAKTLSSMDMTALTTNWHGERGNVFFSTHSSTTQLVEAGVNVSINAGGLIGKDDGRIHVRGVSAPQADWWKQSSENHSLGSWEKSKKQFDVSARPQVLNVITSEKIVESSSRTITEDCSVECDSPMESPRSLRFSTSTSHDYSVPDVIQTPDDVFLSNATAASEKMPQYQEGDSNHLQLPVENQRSRLRRRSLSQNDADSVNVRNSTTSELSQLSRENAVQTCSNTPSCSLSSEQSFSATAPTQNLLPMSTDTAASKMQKKGFSEIPSKPASPSASTNRSPVNPTQVRRRLFRWSIVDKTSIIENVNPSLPPRPPPPSSSDKSQQPSTDKATATSADKSKYLSMTPLLQRRKPPNKLPSVEAPTVKKPQSSIRMLRHLRLSFRLSSRNNSTANADITKPHVSSVTPVVTHIRTSISSD